VYPVIAVLFHCSIAILGGIALKRIDTALRKTDPDNLCLVLMFILLLKRLKIIKN
jgi:hypothetical protein